MRSFRISPQSYAQKVRNAAEAAAMGDAIGVPVEAHMAEQIHKLTGGKGVTGYLEPKLSRIKDTQGLKKGSTSDDTQVLLVTFTSLTDSRGFSLTHQGRSLAEARKASTFGWGGTTTDAAISFDLFFQSNGKEGRDPETPAPPPTPEKPSGGSAPSMKILALAAYDLIGREDDDASASVFQFHAMSLGRMTHGDPRASFASVALGHAIAAFSEDDDPSWKSLSTSDRDKALVARVMGRTMHRTVQAETAYSFLLSDYLSGKPKFSERLAEAFRLRHDPLKLRLAINTGFGSLESVPFAIATALRHPHDPRAGILEGVNAGQDADTVGAMIGGQLGPRGLNGIPQEWIDGLRDRDAILATVDAFCKMVCGVDPNDAKRALLGSRGVKTED